MGLYLLVGGTFILLFMAGPPLIMAYAAYKERRERRATKEG
jgi:hypothetical protein